MPVSSLQFAFMEKVSVKYLVEFYEKWKELLYNALLI